ncbi:TOBE domain-containing protein [Azospirillum thermophilum]|uniref:Molybdenum-dependent transcriptional regulator n=1 Tax=Azospirillum thermophilum TaxID=2202148 RepID=A0A2S2CLR9_9PROT|nr:TOBE domain-containing protein [Azospirillum thermophilum]AWK85453.1 molybdenum-dependent transcriptional regulator [Azospirillum thermophilum]
MTVRAQLSLSAPNASPVGGERIRLLEAVAREGSISAAARAMGISYKAAWDAVDSLNNLFGRPVVDAQTGGRRGGGAALTPEGLKLVETFHRLEAELARTLRALEPEIAGTGLSATGLMWSFLMRTSARNTLRGTVTAITDGAVNAEVVLALSDSTTLTAVITRDSVRDLGLFPGREATALIKTSFVILAPAGEARRTSARNRIEGVIARREDGAVNSEITLDIGGGKTLTAIITLHSADELGFAVGQPACALIDATHVILAVD